MKKVLAFLSLAVFSFFHPIQAEQLSGRVIDLVTREPLEGVNIAVVGTNIGTATNEAGEFSLSLETGRITLVARRIGYENVLVPNVRIKGEKRVQIEMAGTVIEMNQITVTANRSRSLIRDVPEFVSIISKDDLERSNPLSVGEVLQSQNLAYVNQYGILGATESVSLRGSSSTQVLVLWDGQRLNSPLSGGVDLGTIPVESIEKIEAVHGSYSSLYGADAIGGVINLITRKPARDSGIHGMVHSTVGSYGLQSHVVQLSQQTGRLGYFVTANSGRSNGDFSYDPFALGLAEKSEKVKRTNAAYSVQSYFAKLTGELSPATRINALAEWSKYERGVPGSLSFPTQNGYQEDKGLRSHIDVESHPTEHIELKLGGFYHQHELFYKDENPWFPVESQNNAQAYGINGQGTLELGRQQLLVGGNFLRESGDGSNVGAPARNNVGVFTQAQLKAAPFQNQLYTIAVVPSLRYDYYSDFENAMNPRIGLLLSKAGVTGYGVRAGWGSSFHAPTFNDLYWIGDAYTEGNPDLKPEHASTFDYGIRLNAPVFGGLNVDIGAFHKKADDLIQWAGDFATGKWKPQNISSATIVGQEMRIALPQLLKNLSTELNYTRQIAKNSSGAAGVDGKFLIYRPSYKAGSVTTLTLGKLTFSLAATHIGERFADEANTKKLEPVFLLDANVGVKLGVMGYKIDVAMSVKNITARKYQIVYDYPMPGRLWRLKVGFGI